MHYLAHFSHHIPITRQPSHYHHTTILYPKGYIVYVSCIAWDFAYAVQQTLNSEIR